MGPDFDWVFLGAFCSYRGQNEMGLYFGWVISGVFYSHLGAQR
jgi:hypothetical protein